MQSFYLPPSVFRDLPMAPEHETAPAPRSPLAARVALWCFWFSIAAGVIGAAAAHWA